MEWSKEKTLKLIELMQVHATLWNSSLSDTRRDKQKRKEEFRNISEILGVSVSDVNKKIQHLRTQYNRESTRELRANFDEPNDKYVSNWYAYDYLHFFKGSRKPFKLRADVRMSERFNCAIDNVVHNGDNQAGDCKLITFQNNISSRDSSHNVKSEIGYYAHKNRDDFSIFGEYIASELRSLKGEKNVLVAKKKIQNVIFDMKMGMISESKESLMPNISVFTEATTMSNGKVLYTSPPLSASTMEQIPTTNTSLNEIVVNNSCHYSDFKVDTQCHPLTSGEVDKEHSYTMRN